MSTAYTINGETVPLPDPGEGAWFDMLNNFLAAAAAAQGSVLQFGNSATPNGSGTTYLRPSYRDSASDSTEVKIQVPADGVLRNLYAQARVAPSGGSLVYTVRKNGADTALTCTMAAAATQANDATHEVTVAAGDVISIKCVSTASTGATHPFATVSFCAR